MDRIRNAEERNYILQCASIEISEEVINMFKARIQCIQMMSVNADLSDTSSDEEDLEEEATLENILAVIDDLCQDSCRASTERIFHTVNAVLGLPDRISQPFAQYFISHPFGGSRILNEDWKDSFPSEIYVQYFRFEKEHFEGIAEALDLPEVLHFPNGHRSHRMEALHILLRRLSSPNRYIDLSPMFRLRPQYLSVVFNGVVAFLYEKWGDFIRSLDHQWLDSESLASYNLAFRSLGCPLESCVATIDGTKHCFSRPGHNMQEACYCGHWHEHALSYQFLQLPNGLHLTFGPFNGYEHDSTSIKLIDLESKLCEKFNADGSDYCVFLDSGYALSGSFITPYSRKRVLTQAEKSFNRYFLLMSDTTLGKSSKKNERSFGVLSSLVKHQTFPS